MWFEATHPRVIFNTFFLFLDQTQHHRLFMTFPFEIKFLHLNFSEGKSFLLNLKKKDFSLFFSFHTSK